MEEKRQTGTKTEKRKKEKPFDYLNVDKNLCCKYIYKCVGIHMPTFSLIIPVK